MTDDTDVSVRRVSRREAMAGTGVALGSLVASGTLTETVLAQSGGPSDEISGIVEDESGAVQGATVVAVPHDTSLAALATTTASDGTYIFAQSDLYEGSNLYHVIARDGSETDPQRGAQNYPFVAAEGPAAIPDSGTEHQWAFSEGSGDTVTDRQGSADGSITGASWVEDSDAVGGYWLDFDGTDDQIDISDSILPSQNWSVAVTIMTQQSDSIGNLIGSPADGEAFRFAVDGGNLRFNLGGGSSISGSVVADGSLHRVGVSYDGSTVRLAIDGVVDNSLTTTYNVYSDSTIQFGAREGFNHYNGVLDNPVLDTDETWADAAFQDDFSKQPWS